MIKLILFDLGNTLIDARNQPFPHVKGALAAIATFKIASGKSVRSCLVSDFTMATAPVSAAKVDAIFRDYLAVLDQSELRTLFEPIQKRVTLSTHAGVTKPDRRIFETALRRLGSKASFEECLFITENAAHIKKARTELNMATLRFRSPDSSRFDFDDWAQAPALVAHLLGAKGTTNTMAAVRVFLAAQKIDMHTAEVGDQGGTIRFTGSAWHPVSVPDIDDLNDLHAASPIEGRLKCGANGALRAIGLKRPTAEEIAETASFVRSLATNDQIGGRTSGGSRGGVQPLRPTHAIQTDASGVRKLVRKGFSTL